MLFSQVSYTSSFAQTIFSKPVNKTGRPIYTEK